MKITIEVEAEVAKINQLIPFEEVDNYCTSYTPDKRYDVISAVKLEHADRKWYNNLWSNVKRLSVS